MRSTTKTVHLPVDRGDQTSSSTLFDDDLLDGVLLLPPSCVVPTVQVYFLVRTNYGMRDRFLMTSVTSSVSTDGERKHLESQILRMVLGNQQGIFDTLSICRQRHAGSQDSAELMTSTSPHSGSPDVGGSERGTRKAPPQSDHDLFPQIYNRLMHT